MPGRDDRGTPGDRLFDAALADPHTLVWLLAPDGTVRRTGEAALSLVGASAEAVADEPFQATPWWEDSAVEGHVRRATDGEFVRFRASTSGTEVDVVLRPVEADGDLEAVVAVGREVPPSSERRGKLAALHDVATRLESTDDEAAVHELTVEAAVDALDFDRCFVGGFEGETVVPEAWSDALDRETAVAMDLGGWLASRVLGDDRSVVVADVDSAQADAVPDGEHTSWLGVPVGDTALLVAADPAPDAFDGTDRELADVLAAHAGTALRRVRHQQRLRHQNERLEEFASVVAHDLRNPLGAMRANLQVARELDDPEVLDAIERSLDRMDELLADLLELASVGEDATEPERVRLDATALEAWETAASTDATLSVDGEVTLEADPSRLQQLLENLFDNAVEHGSTSPGSQARQDAAEQRSASPRSNTREDAVGREASDEPSVAGAPEDAAERSSTSSRRAEVTVTVGAIDGHGFYVADDGPGIPADAREAVFEHGFTTAEDGTGFGLSIVRRIAETHGWTAVLTESDGGGARFEFTGVDAVQRAD